MKISRTIVVHEGAMALGARLLKAAGHPFCLCWG
jgi:hypothetical protein